MKLRFPLDLRRDGVSLGAVPSEYPGVAGMFVGPFRPSEAFQTVWPTVHEAILASRAIHDDGAKAPLFGELRELPTRERGVAIRNRIRSSPALMNVANTHRAVRSLGFELFDAHGTPVQARTLMIQQLGPDLDDDFRAALASEGAFNPELVYPPLAVVAVLS